MKPIAFVALAGALFQFACGGAAPPAVSAPPAVPEPGVAGYPQSPAMMQGAPAGDVLRRQAKDEDDDERIASNGVLADKKTADDAPHSTAMLVYTANLTMAVYQVGPGLDAVERVAEEANGYLSTREDASIVVRVPRDKFDAVIGRIEKLGDVIHRDIRAQDVTDQFVDLQARLKNAYAVRDRLTELMSKAAVKEAIDIEKELARVTEDIERMEGRMKLMKDQIAFSTITVNFSAVEAQTVHDSSLLAPFPWLNQLGLASLLDVH